MPSMLRTEAFPLRGSERQVSQARRLLAPPSTVMIVPVV